MSIFNLPGRIPWYPAGNPIRFPKMNGVGKSDKNTFRRTLLQILFELQKTAEASSNKKSVSVCVCVH